MKAVGYRKCLPIDDPLSLVDLELPEPVAQGRDLLVRVMAVSVRTFERLATGKGESKASGMVRVESVQPNARAYTK